MARFDFKTESSLVGTFVYMPFKSKNPGVVITDDMRRGYDRMLRVRFIDGSELDAKAGDLNDFSELIEATERKARSHRDRLEQLKSTEKGAG